MGDEGYSYSAVVLRVLVSLLTRLVTLLRVSEYFITSSRVALGLGVVKPAPPARANGLRSSAAMASMVAFDLLNSYFIDDNVLRGGEKSSK